MPVVVDTDVVSFLEKRDTRAELYKPHLTGTEKFISFMTLAELRRWTLEKNWGEPRRLAFDHFLIEEYGIVFADDKLCDIWAKIKTDGRRSGKPIASEDAWIAAVAVMFDIPITYPLYACLVVQFYKLAKFPISHSI